MECPHCHQEIPGKECPHCGTVIPLESNYCMDCGESLDEEPHEIIGDTLFLRVAGAPLDNNLCERMLKRAILHRKNSLFFRTARGACVADICMSLIQTAELAKKDPLHYLTSLLKHHEQVAECPNDWLPWNYEQTLEQIQAKAA